MSIKIKSKLLPFIILSTLFILMLCTISNARVIEFKLGSETIKIDKTDSQWIALAEPTLVEKDAAGNWYIIWAVSDPPRTSTIHYETDGYRVHTIPVSGSGNTHDNTDRTKLINNFTKYGDESLMGNVIELPNTQWTTHEKEKIGSNTYFFRLVKLTPSNINTLFPSGYKAGDKLYFSGIMKNILNNSGTSTRANIRTYFSGKNSWIQGGEHDMVFSDTTRGNIVVNSNYPNPGGGAPSNNLLKNSILPKVGKKYVAAIQGHYDREIILDKYEPEEPKYNAKIKVYKDGVEDTTKTHTYTNLLNGTNLYVSDDGANINFKNEANGNNQIITSPITENYEFVEAKVNKAEYKLGDKKTIQNADLIFELYYKEKPKIIENTINIYKVKKDTGLNYKDPTSQIDQVETLIGTPLQEMQEVISKTVIYQGDTYNFSSVAVYYGTGTTDMKKSYEAVSSILTYTVCGTEGIETNIVIEYDLNVPTKKEDDLKTEPYTDENIDSNAKGHILSDAVFNYNEKNYNVLDGIPSSEYIYSYAEANGYLYKIEGNRYYGTKYYDVIACSFYENAKGMLEMKQTYIGQQAENFEYYTIEKYDIAKLQTMHIENELLNKDDPSNPGINEWAGKEVTIDVNNIANGTEYFEHTKSTTGDENEINQQIAMNNITNMQTAANKSTEDNIITPTIIPLLDTTDGRDENGNKTAIYVLATKDEMKNLSDNKEKLLKRADLKIRTQITHDSDYILVNVEGAETKRIDPSGDRMYLTYDPSMYVDFDEMQDAYENYDPSRPWDILRGKFFVDLIAEGLDLWENITDYLVYDGFVQKVIDKFDDRGTLRERLKDVSIFDWGKRIEILIEWWNEVKQQEIKDTIEEYNKQAKAINDIPRDISKEKFFKEKQQIDPIKQNKQYVSPEDSCYAVYERLAYTDTMIKSDDYHQLINGFDSLILNPESYETYKYTSIGLSNDIVDKAIYDEPGEINSVIVHTPVVVSAKLEGGSNYSQYIVKTVEIGLGGIPVSYVKIGEEYTINLTCEGEHRPILGYKEGNYKRFAKDNIAIRFPYDIEVDDGKGYKIYKAYEWNNLKTSISSIKIRIPEWAEIEDDNGVAYYDIRVSAINDTSTDKEEMGWLRANMDDVNRYRKIYTDSPKDYRAYYSIPVKAIGKVYDFRVNYTEDPGYILTYTSGRMQEGQTGNKVDGFLINNLPIGKVGTNTSNPTYQKAPKLGCKFKFNVKTLGWKTDNITITPKFYFVPKDGSRAEQVDVYYDSQRTGKTVKLIEECDFKLNTTLPKTTAKLTDGQVVTEPGPNSARVTATNKVKDAYQSSNNDLKFKPTDLDRVTSARTTNIGDLGKIQLNEEERFRLPVSNDLKQMAANSIWYGEYKLPSTSKFIRTKDGGSFKPENVLTKAKDGDGYILVCFEITGKYKGNSYLLYQNKVNASQTQWNVEGYNDNQNIQLVNGGTYKLPGSSTTHVGVFLYEAFENNGKDVVNPH